MKLKRDMNHKKKVTLTNFGERFFVTKQQYI